MIFLLNIILKIISTVLLAFSAIMQLIVSFIMWHDFENMNQKEVFDYLWKSKQ
jgi:hypothetical protein